VRRLRVLVACESSGNVRDAFIARGFDAVSCDLLPTERPGPHVQGDVVAFLHTRPRFDLMVAHPPCTYLSVSGIHWNTYVPGRKHKIDPRERAKRTEAALDFVRFLMNQPFQHIAIENPVSIISSRIRKPDQCIQPFEFGHPESKKTCLWLKNLPPLDPTNVLAKPASGHWENQTPSGQNKIGPSPDRWKERSKTYPGIAQAMAEQWGSWVRASHRR
jgi:site-specific DNA-cytosine methylase